jgi:D-alanyl-D-alanine carboxypeptidase
MQKIIRHAALSLAAVLVLAFSSPALPAQTAPSAQSIDRFLSQTYPAAEPGAAVLVAKDGQVLLRKGYGMANLELGVAITPESVFEVGSVTKQFTATATLMLQERGKLSIEDDITKYLTDFPTQGKKVTIENLLTHTSGIPSYTDLSEWLPHMREDLPPDRLIAFFKGKPFDFEPGTRWAYDNSGYALLGAIIEKVYGKSYERFVEDEIFKPLGMTHSSYGSWSDIVPHRAAGYDKEDGRFVNTPYISMTQPYAAGSLMSTVDDLVLWDRALAEGTLLKKTSLDRMLTPGKLASGQSTRYGFGWVLIDLLGRPVIEHGGDINGFSCDVLRIPRENLLVVVLTNNTEAAMRPDVVAHRIASTLLGKPALDPGALPVDGKTLDEYVGVYRAGDITRYFIREGDKLFAQRSGGRKRELLATGRDTFDYAMANISVRFSRDAKGKLTGAQVDNYIGPEEAVMARTDDPLPAEKKAAAVDPATYDAYAATYELVPGFEITITREGDRLLAQATGQEKLEILPESATMFFVKELEAQLEFQKSAGGTFDVMVLHQHGKDRSGKRVK